MAKKSDEQKVPLLKPDEFISYHGSPLGRIRLDEHGKQVFIAQDLECLASLFGIDGIDKIVAGSKGQMLYEEFRKTYIPLITAYFPNMEAFELRNSASQPFKM